LPPPRAVARWAEETPPRFLFAVKVSRYLTHVRRLAGVGEHLPALLERLEPLRVAGKLGPLLWQLPRAFARDDERLAAALDAFPPGLRHALEPRHPSWLDPAVVALLRARNVALVVAGGGSSEQTADFHYVRFHGGAGAGGSYAAGELDAWALRLRALAAAGDVYAYFNNDAEGAAPRDALGLRERLARLRGDAPVA